MKRFLSVFILVIFTFMLSGCILSKTPNAASISMDYGEQMTFSVRVFPPATYTWTLDGVPLSNTRSSYDYTAHSGDHTLAVKAEHFLGTDIQTWNIQTPEASDIAIKVLPEENTIIAADFDGNVIVNKYDEKAITWIAPDPSESLVVYYNDNYLPSRLVFNNCVVLYDNWTSSTVDIAIISPDKPYSIIRGLSLDYDVIASINSIINSSDKNLSKSMSALSVPDPAAYQEIAKELKLSAKILSVSICTGTVVAAMVSAGVGVPAIFFSCGSTVLIFIEVASGWEWAGYASTLWGIVFCQGGRCIPTIMSLSGLAIEQAVIIQANWQTFINNAQHELNPITALLNSLVTIPAGSFMMGSNELVNEQPIHQVTLQSFDIGRYEITQAQYLAVMGTNPSYFQGTSYSNSENRPVEWVTWYEARQFCAALSALTGRTFTLPSEAQWEYACRAGTTTLYSWGDSDSLIGDYAWYWYNSDGIGGPWGTHPVGTKLPNPWGLHDMHGNVWEWCLDSWHTNYVGAPNDGSAWEPDTGYYRLFRGGSWYYYHPWLFRSAGRGSCSVPDNGDNNIGFRVLAVR